MVELTSVRKLKWEQRKKKLQEGATQKAKQISNFVRQNQETLAIAIPAIAVGAKSASRVIGSAIRKSAVKSEERDRKTRFYDHSLGCYWYTKRPLRQDEQLSVQRRKAAGESYGEIFKSMKLLK